MRRFLAGAGRWRATVELRETYDPGRGLMDLVFQVAPGPLTSLEVRGMALPGKLVFRREKGLISLKEVARLRTPYIYKWDAKKKLAILETGHSFAGRLKQRGKTKLPPFDDSRRAVLDADKIRFPLLVRSRREGDRYRPLGAPGRKKLKEIMRAKGIPAGDRSRLPVFLSGGKIIWVLGLPVSEDFKITPATQHLFLIEKL
jgi:tRNA(Ile)-lysidine synthase